VRILSALLCATLLGGCTTLQKDFSSYGRNYDPIPFHLISVGEGKEIVSTKLGAPNQVIGSKRYDKDVVEVWSYERWRANIGNDYKDEEYWVYFLNGELVQWGRPGDWAAQADKIIEVRLR
jgi:hypothetical protein